MDGTHPLSRKPTPERWDATKTVTSNTDYVDLTASHLPPFGATVSDAVRLFDSRAAATISAATGVGNGIQVFPSGNPNTAPTELLEKKEYGDKAPTIFIPTAKCLAALAYHDYFPRSAAGDLAAQVSQAIVAASPGWCGSFGPGGDGTLDVAAIFGKHEEGNYDMSQMHLLQIAYRYYADLSPEAQNHVITVLLATGRIRRPNRPDSVTSGGAPDDWSRAGFMEVPVPILGDLLGVHVKVKNIGETENHILTIHTARYLTNQLLYQRDPHRNDAPDQNHDNRRNGFDGAPSCTERMLGLLRHILRDDFSEYNAKNYQNEVRAALLNLCSYAYDHEVRLAARMVLDYVSAHVAVSSCDLRRMVPFRRRNEGKNVTHSSAGTMEVGLLEASRGADPLTQRFAILAGNTRAYQTKSDARPHDWSIATDGQNGHEAVMDALSAYRLPPSIHDLFVNDLHRRFFQRLHRVPQDDGEVTGRNCDNHEIYTGSPSYLITAGGRPATYAIDPTFAGIVFGDQAQQLGVAVTTSFMPTGISAGTPNRTLTSPETLQNNATDVIQFSHFSDAPDTVFNYGVAPDFACGLRLYVPLWTKADLADVRGNFRFINRGSQDGNSPGFYLAIYDNGTGVAVLEAFDTWLHPHVLTYDEFKDNVIERNGSLNRAINAEAEYTTQNGNTLRFLIWDTSDGQGARVVSVAYGTGDPTDSIGDAGHATDQFLRGTVMNNLGEGIVEISNHFLHQSITRDMSDQWHPKRTSETGEIEEAGNHHEVWVDFGWHGPQDGDFFHPYNTLAGAVEVVADGGVIKIMPGATHEIQLARTNKRIKLVAPIGGVQLGFAKLL